MEAVVLAGGLGTRLRSAVSKVPKPLAPINGRPFLEYQFDYWIRQGINRFILAVGYKHQLIEAHFGANYGGAEILYSVEKEPLGTGGGLLLALDKLSSSTPFLILNGDTFFAVSLAAIEELHKRTGAFVTLGLRSVAINSRYGTVELTDEARITGFRSGTDIKGNIINGGVYLAQPDAFSRFYSLVDQKISLEEEMVPELLAIGEPLYGLVVDGKFVDIGVPEDYLNAASILLPR